MLSEGYQQHRFLDRVFKKIRLFLFIPAFALVTRDCVRDAVFSHHEVSKIHAQTCSASSVCRAITRTVTVISKRGFYILSSKEKVAERELY